MKDIRRYFAYIGKYKRAYFSILAVTIIVSAVMEVMYSYMNKFVFNAVEYQDIQKFYRACFLCAGVLAASYFRPYLRYFEMKQVRHIVFDIKIALFEKLNRLDMRHFEKNHSADALKVLNHDANSLKESYFTGVYRVAVLSFDGVTAIITMFFYSWKLAVVSIVFSVITVIVSVKINKRIKDMSRTIQAKLAHLGEHLSDILSGFLIMKMYPGFSVITEKFYEENENVWGEMCRQTRALSMLEMVTFLIGMFGSFGTILAGAYLASRGEIDYGTIMAVVTLQLSVSGMFQNLGSAAARFSAYLVTAGRVFDFLELDCEEATEAADVEPEADKRLGISIKNLNFAYDDNNEVLKEFSLEVAAGEKVMLTGESGCGKSTLLKLLMRFYESEPGSIRIFGNEIHQYSVQRLREMITYVPQENYLFEGTILENIMFGNQEATESEVIEAAKAAYADEFISELPEKYKTQITAGGKNLSGGQRQRIAIARAFLKDSPILLMDEPSSALDVQSERKINLAVRELMKGRIVLMVTHRTTSYSDFDRMVKM